MCLSLILWNVQQLRWLCNTPLCARSRFDTCFCLSVCPRGFIKNFSRCFQYSGRGSNLPDDMAKRVQLLEKGLHQASWLDPQPFSEIPTAMIRLSYAIEDCVLFRDSHLSYTDDNGPAVWLWYDGKTDAGKRHVGEVKSALLQLFENYFWLVCRRCRIRKSWNGEAEALITDRQSMFIIRATIVQCTGVWISWHQKGAAVKSQLFVAAEASLLEKHWG